MQWVNFKLVANVLILLHLTVILNADYTVFAKIHNFDVPTNKCPVCRRRFPNPLGCCDDFESFKCTGNLKCDTYFQYCLRALGSPRNTNPSAIASCRPPLLTTYNVNGAPLNFSRSSLLGRPNPVEFTKTGGWKGAQVYIQVYDFDFTQNPQDDELVDSFSIDVEQIPIGVETSLQTYNGTFGFAFFELSFHVECRVTHTYPNCDPTCILTGNCTCLPGYTGQTCSDLLNPCHNAMCPENSVCEPEEGGGGGGVRNHTCTCLPGFIGEECKADPCFGVDCSRHGQCNADSQDGFNCTCDEGYTGALCETKIDHCLGVTCSDHGKCLDLDNGYTCLCDYCYSGPDCSVSKYAGVECSGHGRCRLEDEAEFSCVCDQGYTGQLCEVQDCTVSNCSSHTQHCGEDGRCVCRSEYTGAQCETLVGCLGVDCSGSSTCVQKGDGSYGCDCHTGFTGESCEQRTENSSAGLNTTVSPLRIGLGVGGAVIVVSLLLVVLLVAAIAIYRQRAAHDYILPGNGNTDQFRIMLPSSHRNSIPNALPASPILHGAPPLPPRPPQLVSPREEVGPLNYLQPAAVPRGFEGGAGPSRPRHLPLAGQRPSINSPFYDTII